MNKVLIGVSAAISLSACLFALGAHLHSQPLPALPHQKDQGMSGAITDPVLSTTCSDGTALRVMDYSGHWPMSLPIWDDQGVVECRNGIPSVEGRPIDPARLALLIEETLSAHREPPGGVKSRAVSGIPLVDGANVLESIEDD